MIAAPLVANFFLGVFFCNGIPHLFSGLQGLLFPTPFARPRGVGNSAPLANFFWGGPSNVLAGAVLLWSHPIPFEPGLSLLAAVLGAWRWVRACRYTSARSSVKKVSV